MNSATDKGIAESLKVGTTIPLEEYKQPEEILQKDDNSGTQSVKASNGPEFVTLLDVNNIYTLEKWDKRILRGLVRRIGPQGRKWLELSSERPSWITLTAIHCPRVSANESLKIHLPLLVIMMKQMFKRPFAFQISIVDSSDEVRRFMICTPIHSTFLDENKILWVPLQLEKGWNLVEIDLEDFNYQAFGTHFKYVDRIQIHPNCLLKEVYFQNRLNNRNIMGKIQQQQSSVGVEGPENYGFDMNQNQLEMQMMIQKNQELSNTRPQTQFQEKLSPMALMKNAGMTEPNLMRKQPEAVPFLSDEPTYPSTSYHQQRALTPSQQRTLIEQSIANSPPAIEQLYSTKEQQVATTKNGQQQAQSQSKSNANKKSESGPISAKKQKECEAWSRHRKMKSPFPIFSPPDSSAPETKKDLQEQEINDLTQELRNVLMQKQLYNKELSERTSSEILENYLKHHVISPSTGTATTTTTVSTITTPTTAKDTDTNNNNVISSDFASNSVQIKPDVSIKKTDSIAFYKLIKEKLKEYALTRGASTTSEIEAKQLEVLGEFLENQVSRQDLDEDWENEYQKNLSTRLTDFFDREKQIRKAEKVSNIKRKIVSGIREKAKVCDRQGPSLTVNVSNSKKIPAKKKIRRNTSSLVQPPHGFLIPAMTQEEYQMKMQMEEYKRNPGHKIKQPPMKIPNSNKNHKSPIQAQAQEQSKDMMDMEESQDMMVDRKETEIEIHMGANKVKKFNKSSKIYIGILDTIKRADSVWKGIEEEKVKKQQELEELKRLEVNRRNNLALTQ